MNTHLFIVIGFMMLLTSCVANPLNQATSDRYMDQCIEAERKGRLDVAEEACYRSLVNVDWGNLGEEQKSQKLYNLARIKSRLGKLNESADLHKQSIAIEEKLSPQINQKLGRRYVELSIVYLMKTKIARGEVQANIPDGQGEDKLDVGVGLLQKLKPIADQYADSERETVKRIYKLYAEELEKRNRNSEARDFESVASSF